MKLSAIASVILMATVCTAVAGNVPFRSTRYHPRQPAEKIEINSISTGFRADRVILKFAEGTDVRFGKDRLVSLNGSNISAALNVLRQNGISVSRLFTRSEEDLDRERIAGIATCNRELADLNLYFAVDLSEGVSAVDLIEQLNSLAEIETAYPEPIPVLAQYPAAPDTPNWEADQGYLDPAPGGIDARFAWGIPGALGAGITVCDIEGNWVFTHEDLSKAYDDIHLGGSLISDPQWYNHGTAVLGEIAADSNTFGVSGIVLDVDLNTVSIGSVSTADAISYAAGVLDPGDIILIELQDYGPHNYAYVPVEYFQAAFDAISAASAAGVIVVEAGGNGGENLDDTQWYGLLFDPQFRHSGAILVGAGTPVTHSPESFTNYGQRMDLQGWGSAIYTLGYGDLYSSGDTSTYYTAVFGGTSGASPIVVGAVAAMRGSFEQAYGVTLTRDEIVDILQQTGTPQGAPSSNNIGPLPDLRAAIESQLAVFTADQTFGLIPLEVTFTGQSPGVPTDWTWILGDGDSAFVQNPVHTYAQPGEYTVTLQTSTPGGDYSMTRPGYIVVMMDSIAYGDARGLPGDIVEISVHGRNDFPLSRFDLALRHDGDFDLRWQYATVEGTRADGILNEISERYVNFVTKEVVLRFEQTYPDTTRMPPGSGEVARIGFKIMSGSLGSTVPIDTINMPYTLQHFTDHGIVVPYNSGGMVTVGGPVGDVDVSGEVDIDDVVYLIQYIFAGGPPPQPLDTGDANCDGDVDIDDAVYLIAYIFAAGPAPGDC